MSLQVNEVVRFEVYGEQYLQAINSALDFRCTAAIAVPMEEVLSDLVSMWRTWILNYQADDLHVYRYKAKLYGELVLVPASGTQPQKLKPRFHDEVTLDGTPGTDDGKLTAGLPLPTFVGVSARKIGGGLTHALLGGDGQLSAPVTADTKFQGGWRIAGITEGQTQDLQGNKLATAVNWLGTWRTAVNAFLRPSFRFGNVGEVYNLQMVVRSLYGPGKVIRITNGLPRILFRDVTNVQVSQFLGSQITRKQRERFQ